uniref:Doublecortin domain-containing protein n=1 Tax=Macrostomum lignano TaxID=282301 RepID=A0A1I8HVQ3_9PLAT
MQQQQQQQTNLKRTVRVRFYRNGDSHYSGFQMALTAERYRTFEALLDDLTRGPVCNRNVLPQGVRYLFEAQTGRRVRGLQDFIEGGSYVCASFEQLKKLNYGAAAAKKQKAANGNGPQQQLPAAPSSSASASAATRGRIAVILPGGGCRGHAAQLESCSTVTCLEDFFADASVFVAYGNEKLNNADFVLDEQDNKFINANVRSQHNNRTRANSTGPDTPAVSLKPPSIKAQQRRMHSSSPLLEEQQTGTAPDEEVSEPEVQQPGTPSASSTISSTVAANRPLSNGKLSASSRCSNREFSDAVAQAEQSFDRLTDQISAELASSASLNGSCGGRQELMKPTTG